MRSRPPLLVLAGLLGIALLVRCLPHASGPDAGREPLVQAQALPAPSQAPLEAQSGSERAPPAAAGGREPRGELVLRGIVLDPRGYPVARALVYAGSLEAPAANAPPF